MVACCIVNGKYVDGDGDLTSPTGLIVYLQVRVHQAKSSSFILLRAASFCGVAALGGMLQAGAYLPG